MFPPNIISKPGSPPDQCSHRAGNVLHPSTTCALLARKTFHLCQLSATSKHPASPLSLSFQQVAGIDVFVGNATACRGHDRVTHDHATVLLATACRGCDSQYLNLPFSHNKINHKPETLLPNSPPDQCPSPNKGENLTLLCVPPTLTERPNQPISDLRFTFTD